MAKPTIPQNELEAKILGGLIKNPQCMRLAISKGLTEDDFISIFETSGIPFFHNIFRMIAEHYTKYKELMTKEVFQNELTKVRKGQDKEPLSETEIVNANRAYSSSVSKACKEEEFEYLVDQLKDQSILRDIGSLIPLIDKTTKENSPKDALQLLADKISDLGVEKLDQGDQAVVLNAAGSADEIWGVLAEYHAKIREKGGIMTGIPQIDMATKGFRDGQFVVYLGELGSGKSTALLNVAINAHRGVSYVDPRSDSYEKPKGANVIFFSFEMPMWQCLARYMACQTEIPYWRYKEGEFDEYTFRQAQDFLKRQQDEQENAFVFVDKADGCTVELIDYQCRMMQQSGSPPDVIIVDYLGNMGLQRKSGDLQKYQQLAIATVDLRAYGRKHKIPVLTAQQISRDALKQNRKTQDEHKEEDVRFRPEAIRGAMETMEYADWAFGLVPKYIEVLEQNLMCYHQVKGRDGKCKPCRALYFPECSKIEGIADDDEDTETYIHNNPHTLGDGGDELFGPNSALTKAAQNALPLDLANLDSNWDL